MQCSWDCDCSKRTDSRPARFPRLSPHRHVAALPAQGIPARPQRPQYPLRVRHGQNFLLCLISLREVHYLYGSESPP